MAISENYLFSFLENFFSLPIFRGVWHKIVIFSFFFFFRLSLHLSLLMKIIYAFQAWITMCKLVYSLEIFRGLTTTHRSCGKFILLMFFFHFFIQPSMFGHFFFMEILMKFYHEDFYWILWDKSRLEPTWKTESTFIRKMVKLKAIEKSFDNLHSIEKKDSMLSFDWLSIWRYEHSNE